MTVNPSIHPTANQPYAGNHQQLFWTVSFCHANISYFWQRTCLVLLPYWQGTRYYLMIDTESMFLLLCFVGSLLDHRSELDWLHVDAVFSKAWCKVRFPVTQSNIILKAPKCSTISQEVRAPIWTAVYGFEDLLVQQFKKKKKKLGKAKAHLSSFLPPCEWDPIHNVQGL